METYTGDDFGSTRELDDVDLDQVIGGAWAWALTLQMQKRKSDLSKPDGFQDDDPPMG